MKQIFKRTLCKLLPSVFVAFALSLGLFVLLANTGNLDSTELIPLEIFFENPVRALPQLSPDGNYCAYIAPHNGVMNVWLSKKEDFVRGDYSQAKLLTQDDKQGIRSYWWSEDGKLLFYLQDKHGDENRWLYSITLETGNIQCYTPFDGVRMGQFKTHKDYLDTAFISLNKDNPACYDLYKLTLSTGKLELAVKNPGMIESYIIDNAFKVRGALNCLPDGRAQVLIKNTQNSLNNLEDSTLEDNPELWDVLIEWNIEDAQESRPIGFTADNTSLYLVDSTGVNAAQLVLYDLQTKTKKVIASDEHYPVDGVVFDHETHELLAVGFYKEKREFVFFDQEYKNLRDKLSAFDAGNLVIESQSDDKKYYILGFYKDNGPLAYYYYDKIADKASYLFTTRPKLAEHTLASMQPIELKARDGLVLHGYLTLPVDVKPKSAQLPLVLLVHGGPHSRDKWGYDAEVQFLANRGYAVLQINFRGSTGYGKQFEHAGDREWGAKMQTDLLDAIDWAIDQKIADPERIAIYGGSYGGYAALMGAGLNCDRFKCAISMVGPVNLITLLNSVPPYWSVFKAALYKKIGNPEFEPEFLKSRSPLTYADRVGIPLLIAQGANDPRVKITEAEQMVAALKEKNIPYEYMLFENEGHGLAKPENRLKFYQRLESFLAEHLK